MKHLLCLCLALCLHALHLQAQEPDNICVHEVQTVSEFSWNGQPGGICLPSKGLLNALVVFAQFPDDSLMIDNPEWPVNQPPRLMNQWVDSVWTGAPTPYSMTDYFNQMSRGQFRFIGKARFVVAPHSREQYLALGRKRADINEEILKKLDSTMDFAEFDRWDLEDYFVHIERPDKIVDYVIIIWRNIYDDVADPAQKNDVRKLLAFGGDQAEMGNPNQRVFVDNNNRIIKMYYGVDFTSSGNEPAGSGPLLTKNYLLNPFTSVMQTCIHETGHYLIGGNNYHVGFGCWGMISSYGIRNFSANSFERHRLGWINLVSVDPASAAMTGLQLPDYITSGVACRFVIDSTTGQYFFIENHQGISIWDAHTGGQSGEHGVYVLRQDSIISLGGAFTQLRMIPADGCYDWEVNRKETNSCCGSYLLPVFKRLAPDRHNGDHDCDYVHYLYTPTGQVEQDQIILMEAGTNATVHIVKFGGDGQDAFRMNYQRVFSPWSNPTSRDKNKYATGFGFELMGVTSSSIGDVYTLNLYPSTAVDASPAKVQGFAAVVAQGQAALSWQANEEPDLKQYNIYRATVSSLGEPPAAAYQLAATMSARDVQGNTVTNWTDTAVVVGEGTQYRLYYKISAVDSSDYESVKTTAWVYTAPPQNGSGKRGISAAGKTTIEVQPNPAGAQIRFVVCMGEAGRATLEIIDAAGSMVAALLDREMAAGEYTVQFDSSRLANGMYLYRLVTNNGVASGVVCVQR